MVKENYNFWSTDAQTKLNAVIYKPEGETIATVIIAHGIGEHIGRYEKFAEFLTSKKITVAGFDCIGHGSSISKKKAPMYFGEEGSWNYLVGDFGIFTEMVKEFFPDVPCFVLGFSMGSFVVRCALATGKVKADGAILAGTGEISQFVAKMVKSLVSKEAKKVGGDDKQSEKVNEMAFGNYNKYFKPCKTEFDWLCQNEEALQEYIQDPLARKFITPGMFRELLSGMAFASKEANMKKCNIKIPILLVSGENDPVGEFKKAVSRVAKKFNKNGFETKVIWYPNSRHDIFHDNCQEKAMQDIYEWINSQILSK